MDGQKNKVIYISLVVSVLVHVIILILLNQNILFGSTESPEQEVTKPLELVFEQPEQKAQEKRPEKFYEIVENPNASQDQPQETNKLSTESSLSQSPEIQPGQIREVPGANVEEKENSKTQSSEQMDPQVQKALENAMLAYQESRSFNRSALTGNANEKREESEETETQKGETFRETTGFNADLVGDFALSTYAWNWAPYWLAFKRKLNRVWYAPPAYSQLGLIHGYTIVRFKIDRNGSWYDFRVLQHVGHESLKKSSVSAMNSMFPFQPLPDDFPDPYLEVTIKMVYPDLRQFNARQ